MLFSDEPESHRYTAEIDGAPAGFAVYHRRGGRHLLVHTEVDRAFGGTGVGSGLAEFALGVARAEGARVVPICPFVAAYMERHADHGDLVDRALMARIDRPT